MVTGSITTHIPPEAEPGKLIPFITQVHEEAVVFESVGDLYEFTNDRGLGQRPELHLFAVMCGLLEKGKDGTLQLTEKGRQLAQTKSDVRADIAHYLIYTAYDKSEPGLKTESWAYRHVVNSLWQRAPANVMSLQDVIVEEINNSAMESFDASISFSPKSIRGVRKWMEQISPPVIEKDMVSRRNFCHPEVLLLAIGCVMQQGNADLGIDLLLTPDRRDAICRLCVLEPAALDKTLNWMLPLYPQIVVPGTTAGAYGRFLRFLRWPTLADVVAR